MSAENFVLPFQLEQTRIRGRVVKLDTVLDEILSSHNYPDSVAKLVGDTTVLCALLSSMLKFDGVFTLQTQGKGAVSMLVSDIVTGGDIRSSATFSLEKLAESGDDAASLLGDGYMAFTVDQGEYTERYQGIVELKPDGLVASVQNYFRQSEQIATGMTIAVGRVDGKWRGCGIMLQQMPEDATLYNRDVDSTDEDGWRRTMILLSSAKDDEMLSARIPAQDLIFRLFHEEGVRVYDTQPFQKNCRCSKVRIASLLKGMSEEDIDDMTVDGKINVVCEFCSTSYTFDPKDFKKGQTQ